MYSPSWAAPEQLAGQPVSPATDIYSLAVVAIYMISGKAIFADEDVYAGYKKRRHADELVKTTLGPMNAPRGVIDVLAKALAFDPKKRLAKVEELSAELQRAIEPATEEQPRLPPPPPSTAVPTVKITPARMQSVTPVTPTAPVAAITPPEASPVVKSQTNVTAEVTNPLGRTPSAPGVPPAVPAHAAPTPPVIPTNDLTPQTFHAPAVQAWMSVAKAPAGSARRLMLSDVPQVVGDRRLHFVMLPGNATADLIGNHGTKVRVTFLDGPTGRVVHLKGLSCFVAPLGGRPSPAVQLDRSADVALVTPRAQEIGHLRVAQGTTGAGESVFPVGNELVGVGSDDCADPILFDFGPGSDAYFVYTRGRTVPKSGRRG
jgi:serine/threonine-protein kinase